MGNFLIKTLENYKTNCQSSIDMIDERRRRIARRIKMIENMFMAYNFWKNHEIMLPTRVHCITK